MKYLITVANETHIKHALSICSMIEDAAQTRGTGIAKRKPAYIAEKMEEGKAVIALDKDKVIGFCYIESWQEEKYVVNSGLITHPNYRGIGLANAIKKAIFRLSKAQYPNAKLFGITTSMAVMKINSALGYVPVTFSELTTDQKFWDGCKSCVNYDILERNKKKMCLCTGMVCDLSKTHTLTKKNAWENFKQFFKKRKQRKSMMGIQKIKNKNYRNNCT